MSGVSEYDHEALILRRRWPKRDCCVIEQCSNNNKIIIIIIRLRTVRILHIAYVK